MKEMVKTFEKARLAFFSVSTRHFDFFHCKTENSKYLNASLRYLGSTMFRCHNKQKKQTYKSVLEDFLSLAKN